MFNRTFFIAAISSFIALVMGLSSCSPGNHFHPKSDTDFYKISVTITNFAHTHGGSGSILHSDSSGSTIITNRHVCDHVLKNGGVVNDPQGIAHNVIEYKMSDKSDLCLVKINSDLGIGLDVSEHAPQPGEEAITITHPLLMPALVEHGAFGPHQTIEIEDGTRPCTDAEKADPFTGLFCALFGGLPNTIERESQIASFMIQPGSSGSPVMCSDGKLCGLVFAGQGEIGFAWLVPLEAIQEFMHDSKTMAWTFPQ